MSGRSRPQERNNLGCLTDQASQIHYTERRLDIVLYLLLLLSGSSLWVRISIASSRFMSDRAVVRLDIVPPHA